MSLPVSLQSAPLLAQLNGESPIEALLLDMLAHSQSQQNRFAYARAGGWCADVCELVTTCSFKRRGRSGCMVGEGPQGRGK